MEFASAQVSQQGSRLSVTHGGDDSLLVRFYLEPVHQGFESEQAGRPIYKDVPYIWIQFPGDRTRDIRRKVDMIGKNGNVPDPDRFPKQWAAFERQSEVVQEGTPLEEWGPVSKSTAMNYKALNIHTVEQLAACGDNVLHNMGTGGRTFRDKAVAWLKSTEGSAEVLRLQSENDQLRADLDMLKGQVEELGKQRKGGRPKKTETDG